ncbi:MAG: hypothetical protein ACREFT_14775 [Acetobacteraceae bacterium]
MFIERSADRCQHLEALKLEFARLASAIEIHQAEANLKIQELCNAGDWRSQRAVLFLDPYGMAVDWDTIHAVALCANNAETVCLAIINEQGERGDRHGWQAGTGYVVGVRGGRETERRRARGSGIDDAEWSGRPGGCGRGGWARPGGGGQAEAA